MSSTAAKYELPKEAALAAEAADELQPRDLEMEQFTYSVAHDLESALLSIQGFAGYVERDVQQGRSDRLAEFCQHIKTAVARMQAIIGGLLQLSRAGRAAGPPEPVAMCELIRGIAQGRAPELAPQGVSLAVQEDMPTLRVDKGRIRQVFDHLVVNALTHGLGAREPQVTIGSRAARNEIRFFVKDNGPGIAPERHRTIFEAFRRPPTGAEGAAAGLAIVERSVRAQGGRVWVESQPGGGATFWVAFPGYLVVPAETAFAAGK